MVSHSQVSNRVSSVIAMFAVTLMCGACAQPNLAGLLTTNAGSATLAETGLSGSGSTGGPTSGGSTAVSKAQPRSAAEETNSGPLAQARALRLAGNKAEALGILDKASSGGDKSAAVQIERALLALDLGQISKAEPLLKTLAEGKAANWRVHSAYGSALAAGGKHQDAQLQFAKALTLAPDHPSVLNNLALSYALDGKADDAEKLLRRVASRAPAAGHGAKLHQNLALIVGLKGRAEEATRISAAVLPEDKARSNAEMLSHGTSTTADSKPDRVAAAPREIFDSVMRLGAPKD